MMRNTETAQAPYRPRGESVSPTEIVLNVVPAVEPLSGAGERLARAVRAVPVPGGSRVLVGGETCWKVAQPGHPFWSRDPVHRKPCRRALEESMSAPQQPDEVCRGTCAIAYLRGSRHAAYRSAGPVPDECTMWRFALLASALSSS